MPLTLDPLLTLPPPLETGISPKAANGLAFVFAASYVGSLYVAPLIFPWAGRDPKGDTTTADDAASHIPVGHRDHPATMRMRMRAVSMATRLSVIGVFWTVKSVGGYDIRGAVRIVLECADGSSSPPSSSWACAQRPPRCPSPTCSRLRSSSVLCSRRGSTARFLARPTLGSSAGVWLSAATISWCVAAAAAAMKTRL
jgi:hypothetical protein